jgi:hypothetical protein
MYTLFTQFAECTSTDCKKKIGYKNCYGTNLAVGVEHGILYILSQCDIHWYNFVFINMTQLD